MGGVLRDSTGKVIFAFYKEFGELEVLSADFVIWLAIVCGWRM